MKCENCIAYDFCSECAGFDGTPCVSFKDKAHSRFPKRNGKEVKKMGSINWDDVLNSNFVKLEEGTPKTLVLVAWKVQDKFKDKDGSLKPGIEFTVGEEDGVKLNLEKPKTWTLTAQKALAQLKPIIERAEAAGKNSIKISVVKVGDKAETKYSIKEVA